MAELDLGRIRFFDKGEHSLETEYVLWDFVTSGGSTYLYTNKTGSTGKALTNGAYWKCLAKRGLSAFEVWDIMNGGNKTEAQFFDFIQSPANDAAQNAENAAQNAENATTNANTAAQNANAARLAIHDDLALKANHGYGEGEEPKTLKEVETEKASHGYESNPKTLKEVDDDLAQLESDVSLLDAVQGAKIKDIESVLSTINSNQEAKQSIEGTSPLNLPVNAGEGNAQFNLKGITVTNLVENGDFRNGLDGWSGGNPIVENGRIKFINGTYICNHFFSNNLISGHKYYFCGVSEIKQGVSTGTASGIDARLYSGATEKLSIKFFLVDGDGLITVGAFNTPSYKSTIYVADGTENGLVLRQGGSPFSTVEVYYDRIGLIDLTQAFGAGNEPTKEWCDKYFANYFEGTQSVDAPIRVKSVGKNLCPVNTFSVKVTKQSETLNTLNKVIISNIKINPELFYVVKANFPSGVYFKVLFHNNKLIDSSSYTNTYRDAITYGGGIEKNANEPAKGYQYATITTGGAFLNHVVAEGEIVTYSNIQLEEGTTLTPYEPYKESSLYIDNNTKLRSLPNGVKDEIRSDGKGGYEMVKRISDLGVELAEPIITPLITSGSLISRPNGTVYVENVVADAGVYTTKYDVTIPTLKIKSIESITKIDFETAQETKLDVSLAVISDSSFTHPNLTDGDIVFVVYEYQNESLNAPLRVDYYDSRYTVKDTVTDTFYKWSITVADGVPTINLIEA